MNPLTDLTVEEKINLLRLNNCQPKSKGLKFIKFADVKFSSIVKLNTKEILSITGNGARAKGVSKEKVTEFRRVIRAGKYNFSNVPPVVVPYGKDQFRLVCGEHRYNALHGEDFESLICAVVEFESEYYEEIFQNVENAPENESYIKNERTSEDVLVTLARLVKKGYVDISKDCSINKALTDLKITKTKDFPKYREQLRNQFDVLSAVKTYDHIERQNCAKKIDPSIVFYDDKNKNLVSGIAYLLKFFKGGSGVGGVKDKDYDLRACVDACTTRMKKGVRKVKVICSVGNSNSSKISKIRSYKKNDMMKEHIEYCMMIADAHRSGIDFINDVEFVFVPQINNVDSPMEFV